MTVSLSISAVQPDDKAALADLFANILTDPSAAQFHPHPFTLGEASRISMHTGLDLYTLMYFNCEPIGYGLLRGWDEGYEVPSLGIYIIEKYRRLGFARTLMAFLHLEAGRRGADCIRLKVYPHNLAARRLYEHFGYHFDGATENGQSIGLLELRQPLIG
jgi:ribosomal-protein-alanine N-acetyltransferase